MPLSTHISRRQLLAAAGSAAVLPSSFAQTGTAGGTVKFILPVSAGSGVDGIARASSAQLAKALGQNVVIENQPGAGGIVGTQSLIKAAPDGQTLSMVSNNHVIYPSVIKN
jgi:tripartite-type tricarboxylate transporter receptor subunit TctC